MDNKQKLFDIVDKYCDYTILVIGDIILDEYIWGKASRLSPEAPVPVLEVSKCSYILGGASNVANNITSLGGRAILAGVIGDDHQADIVINSLKQSGIDDSGLIRDSLRPTTMKTRLIAHNHQQLARADREVKTAITQETEDKLLDRIASVIGNADLILLSDYAKGVLTDSLTQQVIKMARHNNKPVLVDPKGLEYAKYTGATLITPNRNEAEAATKSPSGTIPEDMAQILKIQTDVQHVLVTLGEDGVLIYSNDKFTRIPAVTSDVYDVTGAGDTLISAIALSIPASGQNIPVSIVLGNYAAGVAVRRTGTTTVTSEELKNIIEHHFLETKSVSKIHSY